MAANLSSSLCDFCGEEVSAFSLRLIPAKKMPRKSLKLYHNPSLRISCSSATYLCQSSFTKHIHRLSLPTNVVTIKCGNCTGVKSVKTQKKCPLPPTTSLPKLKKKKKKRGRANDNNAGLIIPSLLSLRFTTDFTSTLPTHSQAGKSSHQRQLFTHVNSEIKGLQSVHSQSTTTADVPDSRPSAKVARAAAKRKFRQEKKQKQQEMLSLEKALAKAKRIQSLGSLLGDFLGQ